MGGGGRHVRADGRRQSLFVTFGAWLEDDFGFGTAALSAVTFGIGGLELLASPTSAARTDRWGKERSVVGGHAVMVPCGLLARPFDSTSGSRSSHSAAYIGAFEFAVVSTIPIGGELVPGSPGRGIGTLLRRRHARADLHGDPGDARCTSAWLRGAAPGRRGGRRGGRRRSPCPRRRAS